MDTFKVPQSPKPSPRSATSDAGQITRRRPGPGGTMTPRMWHLIGEDAEAMAYDELLPLDRRTKAEAVKAWAREVGEPFDLHHLHRATVHHGVRCWAPPGDYYGGEYYHWSTDATDGWVELDEEYCQADDDHFEDALILDLDRFDAGLVANVLALAAYTPEIHLVSAGDGWPWMSRVIGPATIVVLWP